MPLAVTNLILVVTRNFLFLEKSLEIRRWFFFIYGLEILWRLNVFQILCWNTAAIAIQQ